MTPKRFERPARRGPKPDPERRRIQKGDHMASHVRGRTPETASKAPLAFKRKTPMSSILTNTSSMVALQTLKNINKGLGTVQNEISTGLRVSTAKDNSSSWAIAATMNSDVSSYKKLSESLVSASAMVGVARAASEEVTTILKAVQEKMVQAQDPSADTDKLQDDVDALLLTIISVAQSAQYSGINIVETGGANQTITTSINRDAAGVLTLGTFDVTAQDLELLGAAIADITASSPDAIDTLIDSAITAAAAFGSAQTRIDTQNAFLLKQMDALKMGVSSLVDADMEEASARLTALQTQQQLGIQSLSIANQAPQSILSLFRG